MGKLASTIARWYTRRGKTVVFRNGMSLNGLAMAMWEETGCRGIDASSLCRVLQGKRLFTTEQLGAFGRLVKLTKKDFNQLQAALVDDWKSRLGLGALSIPDNSTKPKLVVELADMVLPVIRRLRESGFNDESRDLASELNERLAKGIPKLDVSKHSGNVYATALFEEMATILDAYPLATMPQAMQPLLEKISNLARVTGDMEISGIAHYLTGTLLYNIGKDAASNLEDKVAVERLPQGYFRPYPLRTLMITSARLGNTKMFAWASEELRREFQSYPMDIQAVILEGRVRANAYLNNSKESVSQLALAWEAVNNLQLRQAPNWIFRKIQLIRTQTEFNAKCQFDSQDKILKKAEEGLDLATKYHFEKYVQHISKMMVQ